MIIEELKEFVIRDEMRGFSGRQVMYRFPNGYGASVVNGRILHSFPFYVELAVVKYKNKDDNKFELTYDTPITNDIELPDNDEELKDMLLRIKALINKLEVNYE